MRLRRGGAGRGGAERGGTGSGLGLAGASLACSVVWRTLPGVRGPGLGCPASAPPTLRVRLAEGRRLPSSAAQAGVRLPTDLGIGSGRG